MLLAAIDYLDPFKGVQLKLLAWESLLHNYPKYRTGHVLVQICLASRNQVKLVRDAGVVQKEIATIVSRIEATYPVTLIPTLTLPLTPDPNLNPNPNPNPNI